MLPILGIPFHYPWLKIGSKQTALGCSCKQSVWYEQEELLQAHATCARVTDEQRKHSLRFTTIAD